MIKRLRVWCVLLLSVIGSAHPFQKEPLTPVAAGYFYCEEIVWSAATNDLTLSGDRLIISSADMQFKGKGSATFLEGEEAVFFDGDLLEKDKAVRVEGGRCNLVRLSKKEVQKKYGVKSANGGIEITWTKEIGNRTQRLPDSVLVKGRFTWRDSSITGYPAHVKMTSEADPHVQFVQTVDSLGAFERKLPTGSAFKLSAAINYHWMGEEWIRIDDEKSSAVWSSAIDQTEINILLDTIPWPINSNAKGVLQTTDQINFTDLDKFMRERMAFFEIPGATLSVIKGGEVIYSQTYGVTNAITGYPVSTSTLFEAGSVTKLFFSFAVMRLYERGLIDLDKPLYEYKPHDQIADERYQMITARHVLSHQSGMANWPKRDENDKFKLKFTPGTRYGYSGKAFEYLKEVVEVITDKNIETILYEEVAVPLGLADVHFKGDDAIETHGANGHKKYVPSDLFLAQRTMVAYSLQTTSQELAKFAVALHKRVGLQPETYAEMFKVHSERSDRTKWGLGVRIEETTEGITYGHSGSTGRGFISNLVFYEEEGLGYAVMTNAQMGGWLSLPLLNEYLVLGKQAY